MPEDTKKIQLKYRVFKDKFSMTQGIDLSVYRAGVKRPDLQRYELHWVVMASSYTYAQSNAGSLEYEQQGALRLIAGVI